MRRNHRLIMLVGAATALAPGCDSPVDFGGLDCDSPHPRLEIGRSIEGTITTSDRQAGDGTFFDPYTLVVRETGSIGIEMFSTEVDSFLVLFDEFERFLDEDDDSGGGFDAVIFRHLERGCYVVWANTFEPETGRYTISAFSR